MTEATSFFFCVECVCAVSGSEVQGIFFLFSETTMHKEIDDVDGDLVYTDIIRVGERQNESEREEKKSVRPRGYSSAVFGK